MKYIKEKLGSKKTLYSKGIASQHILYRGVLDDDHSHMNMFVTDGKVDKDVVSFLKKHELSNGLKVLEDCAKIYSKEELNDLVEITFVKTNKKYIKNIPTIYDKQGKVIELPIEYTYIRRRSSSNSIYITDIDTESIKNYDWTKSTQSSTTTFDKFYNDVIKMNNRSKFSLVVSYLYSMIDNKAKTSAPLSYMRSVYMKRMMNKELMQSAYGDFDFFGDD